MLQARPRLHLQSLQRVFAVVSVSWGLMSSVSAIVLLFYFTVPFGAMGGYLAMAGAIVLFLPLTLRLPPPPRELQEEAATREQLHALSALSTTERLQGAANGRFAIVALVALFVYEAGQGAVQVFLEQFGFRAGMEEYGIGVLGIASFVGLSGGWRQLGLPIATVTFFGLRSPASPRTRWWQRCLSSGKRPSPLLGCTSHGTPASTSWCPTFWGSCSRWIRRALAVATDAVWWSARPGPAIGGYIVTKVGYGVARRPADRGRIDQYPAVLFHL